MTNWKIGDIVEYKLPHGNRICEVINSVPSTGGHYVKLYTLDNIEEIIYSAYDKNLKMIKRKI